jgi:dihydropyrimidinase
VVYAQGELHAQRGAGRYVNRPAFPAVYEAVKKAAEGKAPKAVVRNPG